MRGLQGKKPANGNGGLLPLNGGGAKRGLSKWRLISGLLIALAAGYQLGLFDFLKPPVKEKIKKELKKEAASPPPTTWSRSYNTTLIYYRQRIIVREVKVSNLDQRNAKVVYRLSVFPTSDPNWLRDRRSWGLATAGYSTNPRRVRASVRGREYSITLVFSYPSQHFAPGQQLTNLRINIPRQLGGEGEAGKETIRLALEIPASREGVGTDPDSIVEDNAKD